MASRLRGAVLGLVLLASLAGCVSMPSGGPVLSYAVTQGPGGQSQPFPQSVPQPPRAGWSPEDIVHGFLTASASFGTGQKIARQYLTPGASREWKPNWSATVYSNGPDVRPAVITGTGKQKQATVTIGGTVQANLSGAGSYAVAKTSAPYGPPVFVLVQVGGQWRISQAPSDLLLTTDLFNLDYQLRNLYFFDPTDQYLVPDPVYVPFQDTPTDLMNNLVDDLIHPPADWLSPAATKTVFPAGTKRLSDVTLDGGTAAVNLGGAIAKVSPQVLDQVLEQVSAQLLWTLSGSGQIGSAVQSVELSVNGRPWSPPNSDLNPVQQKHQSLYSPPTGASSVFYYLDGAGNLLRGNGTEGNAVKVAPHVGTGYSQIAVSPGSSSGKRYLAALRGGSLFIGPLGGKLVKWEGAGYTTISWDPAGDLWATTSDQIVLLRASAGGGPPQEQQVPVTVVGSDSNPVSGPFTGLRVAPDGVRVAIIVGGSVLNFGAIVTQPGGRTGQTLTRILLSPFYVSVAGTTTFRSVSWYGPDNVITLGEPGPTLTEYPVNGGSSTAISPQARIESITASFGNPLIAGIARGGLMANTSLTGLWTDIESGVTPAYPG